MLALEKLRGRPLPESASDIVMRVAVVLVLAIVLFSTWNDLGRLFGAS
jgi:regulator of sigma E protease